MKLKRVFAAVTAFAMCAALVGCGAEAAVSESAAGSAVESAVEAAPETEETADAAATEAALRIAGLKGPTTMGLVNLMSDEVASSYDFTMYGAADEIVPLLVKGELDAAAVPANLAATLYNKTNGAVRLPASTRWACSTLSRTAIPSTHRGSQGADHCHDRQGCHP